MRKLVNGKVIDIKNMELFEKASEGIAINRTLKNALPTSKLDINFEQSLYKK